MQQMKIHHPRCITANHTLAMSKSEHQISTLRLNYPNVSMWHKTFNWFMTQHRLLWRPSAHHSHLCSLWEPSAVLPGDCLCTHKALQIHPLVVASLTTTRTFTSLYSYSIAISFSCSSSKLPGPLKHKKTTDESVWSSSYFMISSLSDS